MIYLWRIPDKFYESIVGDNLSRYIGTYDSEKGPSTLLFSGYDEPKKLGFSKKDLVFTFGVKKEELARMDVLPNDGRFVLVNNRVKEIFDEFANADLQYLTPTINCIDGELEGYYLVHILNRVRGINKQESKCVFCPVDPNDIAGFKSGIGTFVYDHDCLNNHHIALESEFGSFVLVSKI